MKVSDIATVPIEIGAALRHRRLFHPVGVLANGTVERLAATGRGLPVESGAVVGRVSKGIGTPGALPDIAGLAWRMPPKLQPGNPWDALLASAGEGRVGRVVLRPVTSWAGATFSSLMPLRFEGDVWWLRARLTTFIENPGLSIDTVSQQIRRTGVKFHIEQACGTAEFAPLARLILNEVITDGRDVAFDPTLYSAPGVQLVPGWLTGLRRSAYRRSRQGRDVE